MTAAIITICIIFFGVLIARQRETKNQLVQKILVLEERLSELEERLNEGFKRAAHPYIIDSTEFVEDPAGPASEPVEKENTDPDERKPEAVVAGMTSTGPVKTRAEEEGWYEPPPLPEPDDAVEPAENATDKDGGLFGADPEPAAPRVKKESELMKKWREFKKEVDWELFTGKKLFAWIGVLCLFIGVGFGMKYSIDRNLIPIGLRLAMGGITGILLIIAAQWIKTKKYLILCHTFVSGGIGVLYGVIYASFLYGFLTRIPGFALLVVVCLAAFVLAVFHKGVSICILGTIGAYLAPVLFSTGSGDILMLTCYLSIINAGVYQVFRYLKTDVLFFVTSVGTGVLLGLVTAKYFSMLTDLRIAFSFCLHLVVSSLFFWLSNKNPKESTWMKWAGICVYLPAAAVSFVLLTKTGWGSLFLTTLSIYCAVFLAYRQKGWHALFYPYSILTFFCALLWVLFGFSTGKYPYSYLIFLLYGMAGGIGPLLLVRKYGVNPGDLKWFKVFPSAIVGVSLLGFVNGAEESLLFWPVTFLLQLAGIVISLIFSALLQVAILILLMIGGGLYWILTSPPTAMGIGFYLFILAAGVLSCGIIYYTLQRSPQILTALGIKDKTDGSVSGLPLIKNLEQWLTAIPVLCLFLLLAASFTTRHPYFPHAGMVTLVCFLSLILFISRRIAFQMPVVIGLLAAVFSQAVWVLNPDLSDTYFPATAWSLSLFVVALFAPFLLYRDLEKDKLPFNTWALFESVQAVFAMIAVFRGWQNDWMNWMPLGLAVTKLPLVVWLLKRLKGKVERNSILAFHGGALLFYISMLPILVLEKGWIGLTLMFEAAALLWLNRRIRHEGLRWVAAAMAPAGLVVLLVHVPDLRAAGSFPILNPCVLSVFAALAALSGCVFWSTFPQRQLWSFDLTHYFTWILIGLGFYFIHLVISDLFSVSGHDPLMITGKGFTHAMSIGLCWAAFGALIWKVRGVSMRMRRIGFVILCLGVVRVIILPLMYPQIVGQMPPVFNAALAGFLPMAVFLVLLGFAGKTPADSAETVLTDQWEPLMQFIRKALLLGVIFMFLEIQLSTLFQSGMGFELFISRTWPLAVASSAGWLIYGLVLLLWPKNLDKPFRRFGIILMLCGTVKGLVFPYFFDWEFAAMKPLLNFPSLLFLLIILTTGYLTVKKWNQNWPIDQITPRTFCGVWFAITAFCVLNIEIAAVFAIKGRAFSMMTHGSLSMQLAYSIGWMVYALALFAVGIRWQTVKVRWAGILLLVGTSVKIFILDLWKLGQLYRVGSFIGLAVVLILVSYLYQRFLSGGDANEADHD